MRYLLFAGAAYYPGGGWEDFRGHYDSVEAAKEKLLMDAKDSPRPDWYQIVNESTRRMVERGSVQYTEDGAALVPSLSPPDLSL
jgi:hypothetical protein